MMSGIREALAAMWHDATLLWELDASVIEFDAAEWAIGIAGVFLALAVAKYLIAFLRRKTMMQRRQSSVHDLVKRQKSFFAHFMYALPRALFLCGVASILIAVGKPYVNLGYREREITAREICYLSDLSGSMGSEFGSTGKTIAEIAHTALYTFVKMRSGQRDRSCYWLFSDNPHLRSDFTTDHDVFLFQVYMAPWGFAPPNKSTLNNPPGRFPSSYGESGTDLRRALQAMMRYFEVRGVPDMKFKAVIIVTDAEPNEVPTLELEEMRRLHIVPFLVHIRAPVVAGAQAPGPMYGRYAAPPSNEYAAAEVIKAVRANGGFVYEVRNASGNESQLAEAFRDINRRIQKSQVQQRLFQEKRRIHGLFLAAGCVIVLLAVVLGVAFERPFGTRP